MLNEAQPEISYDEAKQVINDYFMNLQKERLELNKKAGEEFLNINKGKAGSRYVTQWFAVSSVEAR